MSEFIVEVKMPGKLWHPFRVLCVKAQTWPDAVLLQLAEQFVREEKRRVRRMEREARERAKLG